MIRRCTCILLYEFQRRYPLLALDHPQVVHSLTPIFNTYTSSKLSQTIKHMMDVGSRFKNLEKFLGPGLALVLGCDIAEST
jgi:hypothetical protein